MLPQWDWSWLFKLRGCNSRTGLQNHFICFLILTGQCERDCHARIKLFNQFICCLNKTALDWSMWKELSGKDQIAEPLLMFSQWNCSWPIQAKEYLMQGLDGWTTKYAVTMRLISTDQCERNGHVRFGMLPKPARDLLGQKCGAIDNNYGRQ